jgi:hypothetical protein
MLILSIQKFIHMNRITEAQVPLKGNHMTTYTLIHEAYTKIMSLSTSLLNVFIAEM